MIPVDDDHLQDVAFHITDKTSFLHFWISGKTLSNQLSIKAFYHFYLLTLVGDEKLFCLDVMGIEFVRGFSLFIIDVRHPVFSHQHTFNIRLFGDRIVQVIDHDEVGIVALLKHPYIELVMLHCIERGGFQHIHHIVTQCNGPTDQVINVTFHQLVGVLVVGAEHQLVGMRSH